MTNLKQELMPCPFCGGKAQVYPLRPEIEGDAWTKIHCVPCDVSISHYEEGKHREKAIKKWNTRPQQDALPSEVSEQAVQWLEKRIAVRTADLAQFKGKTPAEAVSAVKLFGQELKILLELRSFINHITSAGGEG